MSTVSAKWKRRWPPRPSRRLANRTFVATFSRSRITFSSLSSKTMMIRAHLFAPELSTKRTPPEPFRKLDSFCQDIRSLLILRNPQNAGSFPEWQTSTPAMPQGFRTFVERQDADSLYTSLRKETMSKRILAASKLEDETARMFLRTARNAHQEGYAAKLLSGHTESKDVPIQRLEDAGLVEREVQISCRKTGHASVSLAESARARSCDCKRCDL